MYTNKHRNTERGMKTSEGCGGRRMAQEKPPRARWNVGEGGKSRQQSISPCRALLLVFVAVTITHSS